MNIQPNVPFSFADVNPEWLTSALRESGVLKSGEVTGFSHRIVGEETGFLGQVVILSLEYSGDTGEAPPSMVLKIPTPLKNRVMGQTIGVYEKEIRFYSSLKPNIQVRTPAFYYGALSAFDDPDVVLERLIKLQKLPVWLIAFFTIIVRIVFGLMPRRYVLLIEDVSHLRMGDQLQGCSEDDARKVLRSMARLHGQFWGTEELDRLTWIQPIDVMPKIMHMVFLQAVNKYRMAAADRLTDRQLSMLDWLQENGVRLNKMLGEHPRTLLHNDFRLDNLCFDDDAEDVMLLDWQTMSAGSAGLDLAYFLSTALSIDTTEDTINEMIEFYRSEISKAGVQISPERMRWLYELGMLATLQRIGPVLFQEQLELGSDRGPQVMQGWADKIYKRLENVDFEGILDRNPA